MTTQQCYYCIYSLASRCSARAMGSANDVIMMCLVSRQFPSIRVDGAFACRTADVIRFVGLLAGLFLIFTWKTTE